MRDCEYHKRKMPVNAAPVLDRAFARINEAAAARAKGQATYGQPYLGPADDVVPNVGNIVVAFDNNRLTGAAQPLPASFYTLAPSFYASIPQLNNTGCSTLQITPN